MSTDRLRLLLVSLQDWPQACRIPKHLALAGFDVSVFTHSNEAVNLSLYPVKFFRVSPDAVDPSQIPRLAMALRDVCVSENPHFIVLCDELSVTLLSCLDTYLQQDPSPQNTAIAQLVRDALGSPAHHHAARSKLHSPALARLAGLQTPEQKNCPSVLDAVEFGDTHGYPVVVKLEFGTAGTGVAVCHNAQDIQTVWPGQQAALQTFIEGQRNYCNGLAYRGQMVCANVFEVLHTYPSPTSPSSVTRSVEAPAVLAATRKFVEYIGFSGIFSLDFIVSPSGECYFLECNPRCIPATYLGQLAGNDLFSALFHTLHGRPVEQHAATGAVIAFFPKEYQRDPASPYLWQAFHDVPWDEPALLRYYLSTLTPDAVTGH